MSSPSPETRAYHIDNKEGILLPYWVELGSLSDLMEMEKHLQQDNGWTKDIQQLFRLFRKLPQRNDCVYLVVFDQRFNSNNNDVQSVFKGLSFHQVVREKPEEWGTDVSTQLWEHLHSVVALKEKYSPRYAFLDVLLVSTVVGSFDIHRQIAQGDLKAIEHTWANEVVSPQVFAVLNLKTGGYLKTDKHGYTSHDNPLYAADLFFTEQQAQRFLNEELNTSQSYALVQVEMNISSVKPVYGKMGPNEEALLANISKEMIYKEIASSTDASVSSKQSNKRKI